MRGMTGGTGAGLVFDSAGAGVGSTGSRGGSSSSMRGMTGDGMAAGVVFAAGAARGAAGGGEAAGGLFGNVVGVLQPGHSSVRPAAASGALSRALHPGQRSANGTVGTSRDSDESTSTL